MKRFAILLCFIGALGGMRAEAASLELVPLDGVRYGGPGAAVGWGFTIENESDYLVVESSAFCTGPYPASCTNPLGTYTDFLAMAALFVGPSNSPLTQGYNPATPSGIGSFAIDAGAAVGDVAAGQIVVAYSLYERSPEDPNFDPDADLIASDLLLAAPAAVVVIPEPATTALLGIALAAFAFARRIVI